MGRFTTLLNDNVAVRTVIGALLSFIILNAGYWAMTNTVNVVANYHYENSVATDYFDYRAISYVGNDDSSIYMSSTTIWKSSYPVQWNDVLWCDNGEKFVFYSSQDSSVLVHKIWTDYRTLPWNYTRAFPYGQTCYITSTISMDVKGYNKVQEVTSAPFVLTKE